MMVPGTKFALGILLSCLCWFHDVLGDGCVIVERKDEFSRSFSDVQLVCLWNNNVVQNATYQITEGSAGHCFDGSNDVILDHISTGDGIICPTSNWSAIVCQCGNDRKSRTAFVYPDGLSVSKVVIADIQAPPSKDAQIQGSSYSLMIVVASIFAAVAVVLPITWFVLRKRFRNNRIAAGNPPAEDMKQFQRAHAIQKL